MVLLCTPPSPTNSCKVCYECEDPFTIILRRHHCRICGRVFCHKCTQNSLPSSTSSTGLVRVCNYCAFNFNSLACNPLSATYSGSSPCSLTGSCIGPNRFCWHRMTSTTVPAQIVWASHHRLGSSALLQFPVHISVGVFMPSVLHVLVLCCAPSFDRFPFR
jgi:hypothetical protein